MKKKEIKDKLLDVASFFACILVIVLIAYFTGFLKGFAPKDFADAFTNFNDNLSNSSLAKFAGENSDGSIAGRNEVYEGYEVTKVPESVLRGVKSNGLWKFIFNADRKVVFYMYGDSTEDFNSSVQNYLSSGKNSSEYKLYAYTNASFSNMNLGNYGATEVCNSLEECNKQRQEASDYSLMTAFMKYCGKTMCIINPETKKYARLKKKNADDATKMLDAFKDWE